MTPDKHFATLPDHVANIPWYMMAIGVAAAKIEMVPMKLLVTILLMIIGGLVSGFGYSINSRLDSIEKNQKTVIRMYYHTQVCLKDIEGVMRGLHPDKNIPHLSPRLGGGEMGNE